MEQRLFSKIEQHTVDDEILMRLREAIVNGNLQPGERLPEERLAEQLAVSRIPIREALRRLEQEGLVSRQPNRGSYVTSFSEHDVEEVFSLRCQLESMAIERAMKVMTPADYLAIRQMISRQDEAARNQDYDDLTRLDMQMHEFICRKADHSRLLKAWYEQHAQCQMLLNMRFRRLSEYTPRMVVDDHGRIVDAMEAGDVERAKEVTREISQRVAQECIEVLQARDEA